MKVEDVPPEILLQVERSAELCHVYEIVTPDSPSSSETVAVRVLSSALVPEIATEPMSLMLATVTVNDCVELRLSPSVAVRTTLLAPTAESLGVPVSLPVELE